MLKTVAAKIAWVGRPASMVFGLALVMALSSCGSGSQETKKPANSKYSVHERGLRRLLADLGRQ